MTGETQADRPGWVRVGQYNVPTEPLPSGETQATWRCVTCGSADVNEWKSWNLAAEWTCDDCTPEDPWDDPWDEL